MENESMLLIDSGNFVELLARLYYAKADGWNK